MIDLKKAPWRRGEPWVPVLSSAAVQHRAPEVIRRRVNAEGALVWRAAGASLADLDAVKISVTSMTKKASVVRPPHRKAERLSPRAVLLRLVGDGPVALKDLRGRTELNGVALSLAIRGLVAGELVVVTDGVLSKAPPKPIDVAVPAVANAEVALVREGARAGVGTLVSSRADPARGRRVLVPPKVRLSKGGRESAWPGGGSPAAGVQSMGFAPRPVVESPARGPEPLVVRVPEPVPGVWNARVARIRALILEHRRECGRS